MRPRDTRYGEFSSLENTAGTKLALSQIRRFTVEYPSSTSFFKLFGPQIGGDTWASTKPHAFSLAAFHLHTSNTY